jgi:hypothetical protein
MDFQAFSYKHKFGCPLGFLVCWIQLFRLYRKLYRNTLPAGFAVVSLLLTWWVSPSPVRVEFRICDNNGLQGLCFAVPSAIIIPLCHNALDFRWVEHISSRKHCGDWQEFITWGLFYKRGSTKPIRVWIWVSFSIQSLNYIIVLNL